MFVYLKIINVAGNFKFWVKLSHKLLPNSKKRTLKLKLTLNVTP